MAALCARGRSTANLLLWPAAALLLIALAAPSLATPAATPDTISVVLDQARLLQLPDRAANVIVGNPMIADLSIQPGGLAVITGKGYGSTNFIVTDKKGAVLLEKTVEVTGPSDKTVVVYRGVTRQTYSCTPVCEPRVTLGDTGQDFFDSSLDKDFFGKTVEQTTVRNTLSTAAGSLASGH
jgi:hypothetical protein